MDAEQSFSRDYTIDWEATEQDDDPRENAALDIIGSVIGDIARFEQDAVKVINPVAKLHYARLLKWSDKIAKDYYGRVHGEINIESCRAEIRLEVSCLDFVSEDEHSFMHYALRNADSIAIEPTPDGMIRIHMIFHYFVAVHTPEEEAEFLRESAQRLKEQFE